MLQHSGISKSLTITLSPNSVRAKCPTKSVPKNPENQLKQQQLFPPQNPIGYLPFLSHRTHLPVLCRPSAKVFSTPAEELGGTLE